VNTLLLLGAGIGVGLVLIWRTLLPPLPPLLARLERLDRPAIGGGTIGERAPSPMAVLARTLGFPRVVSRSTSTDLRLVDRSLDEHLARCLIASCAGVIAAPALAALLLMGGVAASLPMVAAVSVVLGAAGPLVCATSVRKEADQRRRAFHHALGAFLDVVAINLAAGRGVEGALDTAAAAGEGWAFSALRHALYRAKVMGTTPWTGLDELGASLGLPVLQELAASVGLAGDSGARVRASLSAKARSLRARGLADVEAAAQSANERMSLPVILLLCGFIAFIGYPAIVRVLQGI